MKILNLMLLFLLPISAWALSCAPLEYNEKAFAQYDLIFEGRSIKKEMPKSKQVNSMSKLAVHTFQIAKIWKGTESAKEITLYDNIYWGDAIPTDTDMLVFAKKNEDKPGYYNPMCGHTTGKDFAEESLKILKK